MLSFVLLCLASRLFYSLNDVFTGQLARKHDRVELAALRGVSLGFTMAPLLAWVPAKAWSELGHEAGTLLAVTSLTAIANVMALQAARYLPFGQRASLIVTGTSVGSLALGVLVLGEPVSASVLVLSALVIASAAVAASGEHASHEIEPNFRLGALLALGTALLMAWVALLMKRLASASHPLLAAWAWEFGSGLVLLLPMRLMRRAESPTTERGLRYWGRITLASSPTVLGSGASILALDAGKLGLWGALAGTQVLFTAGLGVLWHREVMGARRWACFVLASAAIAGLTVIHG